MVITAPPADRRGQSLTRASRSVRTLAICALAFLAALASFPMWVRAAPAQSAGHWPTFQGDPAHSGAASAGSGPGPPLRLAWRTSRETGALSGAVVTGSLAAATARATVVGLDVETGETEWTIPRKVGPLVPPALFDPEGSGQAVLFVEGSGPSDGALVAVDLATRRESWRVRLGNASRSAPVVEDGVAFVGSRDGFLYAVDATSGELQWRARADGFVDTSPAVSGGRVFAVGENASPGTATLYAFEAATGRRAWAPVTAPGFSIGASSPTVFGRTVYIGFGDLMVRAFNTQTGGIRWETSVRSDFSPLSAPALAGGDVFAADGTGGMYRLDGATGDLEWEFQSPSLVIWGSPMLVGTSVYLGLQDGTVASFDVRTGHRTWKRTLVGGPVGPFASAEGRLLVPLLGRGGGIVALAPDPSGVLGDVPSPTDLRPGVAVGNFVAAFGAILVAAFVLSRLALRRMRPTDGSGPQRAAPNGSAADEDGRRG